MILSKIRNNKRLVFAGLCLLAVILRLFVGLRGNNFDVDSYWIVANIVNDGGNVYFETVRYNYGPIWFSILGFIFSITAFFVNHFLFFRLGISLLLSLVDVLIAQWLNKKFGLKIAAIFLLNPVSIIISGYHSQFDNLAILLGLYSITLLGNVDNSSLTPRKLLGLVVLGLSLMTKHILFLFPLWIALKQPRWFSKFLYLSVPVAAFLSGFMPFWHKAAEDIINNVFLYRSFANAPFWNTIAPAIITNNIPTFILFILALIISGFILRRANYQKSFFYYLVLLVLFSSAIANQYLAIAVPFVAVYWNWALAIYTFIATLYLTIEASGLHLGFLQNIIPLKIVSLNVQSAFLALGVFVESYKGYTGKVISKAREFVAEEFAFIVSGKAGRK